jgi:uncharacterized membrane protein YidH (DUF202 family)
MPPDPGAARERTQLAWQRTGLSLAAIALLLAVATLVAVPVSIVLLAGAWRVGSGRASARELVACAVLGAIAAALAVLAT